MIDGIKYREGSEGWREFLKVVHDLLGVTKDRNGVVVKLLTTCPCQSLYTPNMRSAKRL